jgi:2-(1,2-epoxy-1,2-dihydrophenyl)acetyl-CoA isomerase
MAFELIELEMTASEARIVLSRPKALNALSLNMMDEFNRALDQVENEELRVLTITGSGRAFCVGADLNDNIFSGGDGGGYGQSVADSLDRYFNPLVRRIRNLDMPVLAAINGVVAGGGIGIALAADICIAARSASFVSVFGPKLGIVPDAGSSWFVPRLVGRARALGVTFLGEPLSAEQAAEWGLIWRVVDDEALEVETRKLAAGLATAPTLAFPAIRKLMDEAPQRTLTDQLEEERQRQRVLADSLDTIEGIAAFRERRTPTFVGR